MEQLKLVTSPTNEERNFPVGIQLRRYNVACDLTGQRFNVAKPFLTNRVALAAAGPVAIEKARDIDRSLLLSASRQE